MEMTATWQAVLYYMRKRRRGRPAVIRFALVPDPALNNGTIIQIIDRNDRFAKSNGVVWQWLGTSTTIT